MIAVVILFALIVHGCSAEQAPTIEANVDAVQALEPDVPASQESAPRDIANYI